MDTSNAHWYARNASRNYPLDDAATARGDSGGLLPGSLLADLSLRWPRELGRHAFVSAAALGPGLATLVFQATDDLDDLAAVTALAAVSVPRPIVPGRLFQVSPYQAFVDGWVVFGSGAADAGQYSLRFGTGRQGLLSARAARPFRRPGLLGVRSDSAGTWLAGDVRLRADSPLTLGRETRVLDGRTVSAIVFALVDDSANQPPTPTSNQAAATSVFQKFAGPCGKRPESRTCDSPQPIQTLAGISPDCNGRITIVVAGNADGVPLGDGQGIAVGSPLSLADICPPSLSSPGSPGSLPTLDGLLPSQVAAQIAAANVPFVPSGPSAGVDTVALSPSNVPYQLCANPADDYGGLAAALEGSWGLADDQSPDDPCGAGNNASGAFTIGYVLATLTASRVNVLRAADVGGALGRIGQISFKLMDGPPGAKHNAGGAVNVVVDSPRTGVNTYFGMLADYDRQLLRIVRFDGRALTDVVTAPAVGLGLNLWYSLSWRVEPGAGSTEAKISMTATSLQGPAWTAQVLDAVVSAGFGPGTGQFGLLTDRSIARFGYLEMGVG